MDNKKILRQIALKIKCDIMSVIPDEIYLKCKYFVKLGNFPDFKNPKTFNEKQNWLKLHDRKPEYTVMADKYLVKKYVADRIGEEHIIPLLGVWDSFGDIDFDSLPDSFVLKPNNGCGGFLFCRNKEEKEKIDYKFWKKFFDINLSTKYYVLSGEWSYKNIPPKIIAEKYMTNNSSSDELSDYKFFCFNGEPLVMFIATQRNSDCRFDYYDMEFNHLDLQGLHPNSDRMIEKPVNFEEMKRLCRVLAKDIPFVRIDFYSINNKVYFGEFTFYNGGGYRRFSPESWNRKLGEYIDITNIG